MNRKSLVLFCIGLVALAVLATVFSVLFGKASASKIVVIEGIEKCSSGIGQSVITSAGTTLYGFVVQANDYNKTSSLETYRAKVRPDSCQQDGSNDVQNANGDQQTVRTSSAIVDIAAAKQSWKITYDWVADNDSPGVDLGTITPTCLKSDELVYGDFGCSAVLNLQKYGTTNYDPILQYTPYSGDGFTLDYDPKTREVAVTILMPADQKNNSELLENNKAIIPYWFQHRNLDIHKYTVTYSVKYQ